MRPPDLEALGVMRLFEPRGSVAIYLLSEALYIGQRSIFHSNRLIRWCNQLNFELNIPQCDMIAVRFVKLLNML